MDLPAFPSIMYNPFSTIYQTPTTSLTDDLEELLQFPSSFIEENDDHVNKQRKASSLVDNEDINPNDMKKKQKIVHREIERQRRFEMSSLHASLRSLLPHEYIKGKRAMSDHLGEAVKYIRQLQQNMKELHDKREALKREMTLKNPKPYDRDVKVEACKGGVGVIVTTSCGVDGDGVGCDQGLPLSKVVHCLIQEGLDVVSCISQRIENSKLVHSIQTQYITAQVEDAGNVTFDAVKLQRKLEDL